jgi:hypothetical protein
MFANIALKVCKFFSNNRRRVQQTCIFCRIFIQQKWLKKMMAKPYVLIMLYKHRFKNYTLSEGELFRLIGRVSFKGNWYRFWLSCHYETYTTKNSWLIKSLHSFVNKKMARTKFLSVRINILIGHFSQFVSVLRYGSYRLAATQICG